MFGVDIAWANWSRNPNMGSMGQCMRNRMIGKIKIAKWSFGTSEWGVGEDEVH